MKAHKKIDFAELSVVWEFYEKNGLNASVANFIVNIIRSKVLVVGSGQGVFCSELIKAGFEVTGLEREQEMAVAALERRGMESVVIDFFDFLSPIRYETIVLSTGLIDDLTALDDQYLDSLLVHCKRLLASDGKLVIAFFNHTPWIDYAESLGLYDKPSRNQLLWDYRDDLSLGIKSLKKSSSSALKMEYYEGVLREHAKMIVNIGHMYNEKTGRNPRSFIGKYTGFYPYDLQDRSKSNLRCRIRANGFCLEKDLLFNAGDTGVFVCGC